MSASGPPDFEPPRRTGLGWGPDPATAKTIADLWVYGTPDQIGLIDEIRGGKGADSVAKDMAKRFIGLYQAAIRVDPRLQGAVATIYLRTDSVPGDLAVVTMCEEKETGATKDGRSVQFSTDGLEQSPVSSEPPGFAALAKRISSWTTNSLLTLLVLVAGLGFGRQVLKWWRADASPPAGRASFRPAMGWATPCNCTPSSSATRRGRFAANRSRATNRARSNNCGPRAAKCSRHSDPDQSPDTVRPYVHASWERGRG